MRWVFDVVSGEDTLNHRSGAISEFVQDDLGTMWGEGMGKMIRFSEFQWLGSFWSLENARSSPRRSTTTLPNGWEYPSLCAYCIWEAALFGKPAAQFCSARTSVMIKNLPQSCTIEAWPRNSGSFLSWPEQFPFEDNLFSYDQTWKIPLSPMIKTHRSTSRSFSMMPDSVDPMTSSTCPWSSSASYLLVTRKKRQHKLVRGQKEINKSGINKDVIPQFADWPFGPS